VPTGLDAIIIIMNKKMLHPKKGVGGRAMNLEGQLIIITAEMKKFHLKHKDQTKIIKIKNF